MSYCVNCGVELAESEKSCPLCDTVVINPGKPWKEPGYRPYPSEIDIALSNVDRRYIASLMTVLLLIPMFVTLVTNLVFGEGITWSGYVLGAGCMLFVWVILPFYFKRFRRMLFLGLDCLAMIIYLLFIDVIMGKGVWFFPLGLPISGTASILILAAAYMFRRGRGQLLLMRAGIIFLEVSILVLVIEISVDLYAEGAIVLTWSPFVIIPCVILAVVTQIVERRKNLKEEIRKRIFY